MFVWINVALHSKGEVIGYEHCKKQSHFNKLSRMYKTNNTANCSTSISFSFHQILSKCIGILIQISIYFLIQYSQRSTLLLFSFRKITICIKLLVFVPRKCLQRTSSGAKFRSARKIMCSRPKNFLTERGTFLIVIWENETQLGRKDGDQTLVSIFTIRNVVG